MPAVTLLKNKKIAFPQEAIEKFGLKEDDLLEMEIQEAGIFLKPLPVGDRIAPQDLRAFRRALKNLRADLSEEAQQMSEAEVEALVAEAIQEIRKTQVSP